MGILIYPHYKKTILKIMAFICGTISTGYELECSRPSGSTELYLSTFSPDTDWTTTEADGITGVTGANIFYKFNQPTDVIAIGSAALISRENRSHGVDNTVTFKLYGMNTETFNLLITLQKTDVVAIVKSRTDRYLVFGVEVGGFLETGEGGIEATRDGMNGYTLTLKWDDTRPPYEMDEAVFLSDIVVGG